MNDILVAVIIVYCVIEFISAMGCIVVILSNDEFYYNKSYIKSYLEFIHNELIYEDRFNFPLSKIRICRYTTFGKIFFMIVWVVFLGIPFILAVIINFFLLRIVMFFKKLLFKDPEENTQNIDH